MKPRRYRLPPPKSGNYESGLVLTCAPRADDPQPHEMVELIPVGPGPLVLEALPEGVSTRRPPDAVGASKTAVVAAVVRMVELLAPAADRRSEVEALARDFVEQLARVVAGPRPSEKPSL